MQCIPQQTVAADVPPYHGIRSSGSNEGLARLYDQKSYLRAYK